MMRWCKQSTAVSVQRRGNTSAQKARRLLLPDLDLIIAKLKLSPKHGCEQLLADVNCVLDQYDFEQRSQAASLSKQTSKFNGFHASLKRLKRNLPSRGDPVFNAISRLGDDYANRHGPHPGIVPREMPSLQLPELDETEIDFRSSRRLNELIETVNQIDRWLSGGDKAAIPNMGWKQLERLHGETRPAFARLIGKRLPAVYEKHVGPLGRSANSNNRGPQTVYKPWVTFIFEVTKAANIEAKSLGAIAKMWERMRRSNEPFELIIPVGPQWVDSPD
jgi:hypothetical protein